MTLDAIVAVAIPYAKKHWSWDDEVFIREQLESEMPLHTPKQVQAALDSIAEDFDLEPASYWNTP